VKKELDQVDIPEIPTSMLQLAGFRNAVAQAVVTTSMLGHSAFDFIDVVERKETTYEELAYCPPEFDSVDQKLLKALQVKTSNGKHGTMMLELNQYYEDAKRARRTNPDAAMLRGRQALWLVYEHFRTTTHDGTLYGFRHLQLVEWKGDSVVQMEYYDAEITRVLGGMENTQSETKTYRITTSDSFVRRKTLH